MKLSGNISFGGTLSGDLRQIGSMSGKMSNLNDGMSGESHSVKDISGQIITPDKNTIGEMSFPVTKGMEYYYGNYTVTPKAFSDQQLQTQGKTMTGNVTVKEVPYYETSNDDGGETVYIASGV